MHTRWIRAAVLALGVGLLLGTLALASPTAPLEDPEVVVSSATDYVIQPPKIFYLNNPPCAPIREPAAPSGSSSLEAPANPRVPETPADDHSPAAPVEQLIGRTAVHGAETREMYAYIFDEFCAPPDDPDIISDVAADDDYVYYVSAQQDALVKISENRLDWETTPPEVVYAHTAIPAELVIVGENIYMLQTGFLSNGLYRINKNTGVPTQLLNVSQTGSLPGNLKTDGDFLYWTYSASGDRFLRSYDIDTPGTVIPASFVRSFYPSDDGNVYIGFEDVIRVYDTGTGSLGSPIYTSAAPSQIVSINADSSFIYFIQQQLCTPACPGAYTLYRMPIGGGSPTPLFAPPVDPVQVMGNLQRSGGSLFFLHSGELKRLRTDAESAVLTNLSIDGIEITQGIQNDSNSVELVQEKRTVARLFVSSDGASIPGVFARLYRVDGSGTTIAGPLWPINLDRDSGYLRVQTFPDKDNISDSFTFFLPPSWVDDPTLRMRAELNPFRFPPESTYTDNMMLTGTFNLDPSGRLETRFVLFEYESGGTRYQPDFRQDFLQTLSWIRRAYPLASTPGWSTDPSPGFRPSYTRMFDEDLGGNVDGLDRDPDCQARIDDPDEDIDPDLCAAWYVICPAMDAIRAAEDLPDSVFLVGMVADDAGFPRGWACGGGVSTPSGSGLRAWDTDGSYADWYAGHEIGHSQGRAHPDSASDDPATDGVREGCGHSRSDSGFPWMNAAIGDGTYRGFDMGSPGVNPLLTPRVYASSTWTDMMSYCDNQWISDYTFEAIKDQVESRAPERDTQLVLDGPFLQLSGVLFPTTNVADLTQVRLWADLTSPQSPSAPGDYRIRLLDGGVELAAIDFTPLAGEDETALIVSEFVPFASGTDRVEITHPTSGDLVWAFDVSPTSPLVGNVQLVGAPSPVTGDVTLQWTGADADGDSLTYDVLYSKDDGASWQIVEMGITDSTLVIETDDLGGSTQARFKVIANDGLNQGEAQSPAFTMSDKAPIVTILSPLDGAGYAYGQEVYFAAEVYDLQEGSLSSGSIIWRDQTNFTLGFGTEFSQDNLLIGENVITVTASNSAGLDTLVTFSIFVNDELELPEATLTVGPDQIGWHIGDDVTALQTASISVNNSGADSFTVSVSEDADWLSVSQSGGSTPLQLTLIADPSALGPSQTFSTELQITGTSTAGTQIVPIPVTIARGYVLSPFTGGYLYLPTILKD